LSGLPIASYNFASRSSAPRLRSAGTARLSRRLSGLCIGQHSESSAILAAPPDFISDSLAFDLYCQWGALKAGQASRIMMRWTFHVVTAIAPAALACCPAARGFTAPPTLGGCSIFPGNNVWNTPIDTLPVDSNSAAYITTIGPNTGLHPDFGTVYQGAPNGIPYVIVPANQAMVNVTFTYWEDSDPGPYPIPPNPPIEGGPNSTGDRHILILQQGTCKLFELYAAYPPQHVGDPWTAGSGAIFDLSSNALRTDTYTSADAAGLPMLPGLVRYEEVQTGVINHALRFTCVNTRKAHIWPARHDASTSTSLSRPPMGQRFRLKSTFVIASTLPQEAKVILTAMKKYGIILADNGSNWYISGVPNPLWNDSNLAAINTVHGSDFEAVDESSLRVQIDSAQASHCPSHADVNGDSNVNIDDLLGVINGWGVCNHCGPDVAPAGGNNVVNIDDLLAVINGWGPCS
jgi:hypothetical protein